MADECTSQKNWSFDKDNNLQDYILMKYPHLLNKTTTKPHNPKDACFRSFTGVALCGDRAPVKLCLIVKLRENSKQRQLMQGTLFQINTMCAVHWCHPLCELIRVKD